MQETSVISISPGFNSYSNIKRTEIAAPVVASEDLYHDELYFQKEEITVTPRSEEEGDCEYAIADRGMQNSDEDAQGDTEFEFAIATTDSDSHFPIFAHEIFHNGQIRPLYPVFHRDLFMTENGDGKVDLNEVSDDSSPVEKAV